MADFDWMALWQNAQPDAPCADENCDTCLAAAASLREQIDVAFVAREAFEDALIKQGNAECAYNDMGDRYCAVERHLLNLLAVIHRDGGHRTNEVGIAQAYAEAEAISVARVARAETAEAECARLRDALVTIQKAQTQAFYWPPNRRDETLNGIGKVANAALGDAQRKT